MEVERDGIFGHFPFGQPSTVRPPRKPAGPARALVLGVYPSALHVRWRLPRWATTQLGLTRAAVGALAVNVEPEVFWDGNNAEQRVQEWKQAVGWREGDKDDSYGYVSSSMNGTSGISVRNHILEPLGLPSEETWFTDAIPHFFMKRSGGGSRAQQADVIREIYEPIAKALALQPADLPERPSPKAFVDLALATEKERLRNELAESQTPLLITLGEEARRVLLGVADEADGPPQQPLRVRSTYGQPGRAAVNNREITWLALTHPGNRSSLWRKATTEWRQKVRGDYEGR